MALSGLTALESEMLDALMTSHERHALPVGFLDQQPEITSRSRQQLADWMIEVCFFKPTTWPLCRTQAPTPPL